MSIANDFALGLTARIQQIRQINGFETDIGAHVFRGRRVPDEDKLPCAIVVEGEDRPADEQRGRVKIEARYQIEGHCQCDPDNPNDVANAMVADIKRAVFSGDPTFGKIIRDLRYGGRTINPREDGLSFVSASVEIVVTWAETLSAP